MAELDVSKRQLAVMQSMVGRIVEYNSQPEEVFVATGCRHLPSCTSYRKCLETSDRHNKDKEPRIYYNQGWLKAERCISCRTPVSPPVLSFEKLPRNSGRTNLKVLVMTCSKCKRVLYAYQPILESTPEYVKASKKKAKNKRAAKKAERKKKETMSIRDAEITNEKDFTSRLIYEAHLAGWDLAYHTFDSRHSAKGFPDLVLLRPPRIIFAELKMNKRKLSPSQEEWIAQLKEVPTIEAYVWRYPADVEPILKVLE